MRDEAIVARVRAGDLAVFETLYRAHFDELWRAAHRIVQSRDGAKDIVQDAFAAIWTGRADWYVTTSVRAYLHGAVRNRSLEALRHDRTVRRMSNAVAGAETWRGTGLPDSSPAEATLEIAVARELARLPERQQAAVSLRWVEEMTFKEIGSALGISEVAARKLVLKARERLIALRDQLRGTQGEPGG